MAILNYMATVKAPVGISELSKSLSIPKSSVFNILHTLLEGRYVEAEDKRFTLGFRLFQTGIAYLSDVKLHQVAHPLLHELMERTNETVHLVVEDEKHLIFIDSIEAENSLIRSVARLGRSENPMYCSGVGKALLAAWQDEALFAEFRGVTLTRVTDRTVRDFGELWEELKETRRRGYALDSRESGDELCCVACPVYDRTSQVVAAISCSYPFHKSEKIESEIVHEVSETALLISQKLGYTGDRFYQENNL